MEDFSIPGAAGKARMVPGYFGYAVTDGGEVWSLYPPAPSSAGPVWLRLRAFPHRGYLAVTLYRAGRQRFEYVHRLVLRAFVGECPPGLECCHWDGDGMNNALGNLRWDTPKANGEDRVRHGRSPKGSRNNFARADEGAVRLARSMYVPGGFTQEEIGRCLGLTQAAVSKIVLRRTWRHVA